MIAEGFGVLDLPLCGMIRRDPALAVASRHLGLVQAREDGALDDRIDAVAAILARDCNLDAIRAAAHATFPADPAQPRLRTPGQRIAPAADAAFAFQNGREASGGRERWDVEILGVGRSVK